VYQQYVWNIGEYMNKVRIACVGDWHVHGYDFGERLLKKENCVITLISGKDREHGGEKAKELSCRFEPDYQAALTADDVDGVIITTATAEHAKWITVAANAGKHVFVEKALATTNDDAEKIANVIKHNNIHFTMSDPTVSMKNGAYVFAKNMIDSRSLGKITNAHFRFVNPDGLDGTLKKGFYNPAESGGGVMIDVGQHSAHVLYYLLGMPLSVTAMFESYSEIAIKNKVEENGTALYRFPNGILGVIESNWYNQKMFEDVLGVFGTKGCLIVAGENVSYTLENGVSVSVAKEELPTPPPHPLDYWFNSIVHDTPNELYGIDEAVDLAKMATAAYKSAGKETPV
jgi:predicted dehydrogenase